VTSVELIGRILEVKEYRARNGKLYVFPNFSLWQGSGREDLNLGRGNERAAREAGPKLGRQMRQHSRPVGTAVSKQALQMGALLP
jgi:hypothetical protein